MTLAQWVVTGICGVVAMVAVLAMLNGTADRITRPVQDRCEALERTVLWQEGENRKLREHLFDAQHPQRWGNTVHVSAFDGRTCDGCPVRAFCMGGATCLCANGGGDYQLMKVRLETYEALEGEQ